MPPIKQKWSVTRPGPGITSHILSRLLGLLFGVQPATIRSYFTRQGLSLSSLEDVASYVVAHVNDVISSSPVEEVDHGHINANQPKQEGDYSKE